MARRPHIVVATPGRLLDLVDDGSLSLSGVRYAVLDEADKMLGMGFQPQVDRLRALLLPAKPAAGEGKDKKGRRQPQVGLFTATMPESLAEVAAGWLRKPERVHISHSAASISRSVTQVVQVCAEHKKPAKLAKHLAAIRGASQGMRNPPRVLIFANRIKTVRFLHKEVGEAGYRAAMLHGERSQEEREAAMHDFRSGKVQVLVATDVAARGLHIRGLPYVVNYDFPPNLETYIHRAGRTGRLAADGHVFSFLTREMAPLSGPLLELLRAHEQAVDPNLVKLAEAYQLAADRLGLAAAATGEEPPARPQTDEVLRTLGLKTKQQRKRKSKAAQQAEQDGEDEDAGPSGGEGSSGEEGEGAEEAGGGRASGPRPALAKQQQRAKQQQQQQQQQPDDAGEEPAYFIPSKTFKGARPGYAFKKGLKGVGYYLDPVQQAQQAQRAGGGGGRAGRASQQAKQQHQRELEQRYARAPVGGAAAAAAAAGKACAGGKPPAKQAKAVEEGGAAGSGAKRAKPSKAGAGAKAAARPLLPGQRWRAAEQQEGEELALGNGGWGAGGGGSDSEDGAAAAAPAASKRKRALPGRIRKKLAAARGGKEQE